MVLQPEQQLQMMVCDYLRLQYPGVIFRSDIAAGMKLTMGQAIRQKRMQQSSAYPDLFIAQPMGKYHGLFIELKPDGTRLHRKDGEWASPHLKKQNAMLNRLTEAGYFATFGVGFDDCINLIKWYFSGGTHSTPSQLAVPF